MIQGKTSRVEHLKTVILVVLFFTTILLLYLLWTLDSRGVFRLPDILPERAAVQAPEAESLLIPQRVVYSMGDGSYRRRHTDTQAVFLKGLSALQSLAGEPEVALAEITREQYDEAMKTYRSLTIDFGYSIPLGEFCSRWEIPQVAGMEGIRSLNALAFSEAAGQSIFIAEGEAGRYYRVYSQGDTEIFSAMLEGEDLQSLTACYTVGNILGGDNPSLIPLSEESGLAPLRWQQETEEASQDLRQALAESLFGENFDFVRRITDNFGNVTYMYGYGQKTFTQGVDGVLEYKSETPEGTAGGFFRDLETALSFVASHGTWEGLDGQAAGFFLADAQALSSNKREGHRFLFGLRIEGQPIYYESGVPIQIDVLDGQISYYRRDVIFAEAGPQPPVPGPTQDPANVIARNYNHIYNVMTGNVLSVNEESAFQYVAAAVRDIRQGLVRIPNDDRLQPAWILVMESGQKFYFSLYEAIPIGMSK